MILIHDIGREVIPLARLRICQLRECRFPSQVESHRGNIGNVPVHCNLGSSLQFGNSNVKLTSVLYSLSNLVITTILVKSSNLLIPFMFLSLRKE